MFWLVRVLRLGCGYSLGALIDCLGRSYQGGSWAGSEHPMEYRIGVPKFRQNAKFQVVEGVWRVVSKVSTRVLISVPYYRGYSLVDSVWYFMRILCSNVYLLLELPYTIVQVTAAAGPCSRWIHIEVWCQIYTFWVILTDLILIGLLRWHWGIP